MVARVKQVHSRLTIVLGESLTGEGDQANPGHQVSNKNESRAISTHTKHSLFKLQ